MQYSMTILLGVYLLCSSIASVSLVSAESVPPVIRIATQMGDVTFNHADHQVRSKGQCTVCHHEGTGTLRCSKCHDGVSARIDKEVVHETCKACHKLETARGTPKVCGDCHKG